MFFESVSTMLALAGVLGEVQVNEAQPHTRIFDFDDDPHSGAGGIKRFSKLANHEQWVQAGIEAYDEWRDDEWRDNEREFLLDLRGDWPIDLVRYIGAQVDCDLLHEVDGAHSCAAASLRALRAHAVRRSK